MKDKNRKIGILFFIAAAMFCFSSAFLFIAGNTGLGSLYLILGSVNLCNGSLRIIKCSEENEEQ